MPAVFKEDEMSILVKGMEMPTTCRYCEFERIGQFGGEWCALTKTDIPRKPIKRLKDCPLVEVPSVREIFEDGVENATSYLWGVRIEEPDYLKEAEE